MDFSAVPPEITSSLIYAGPGPASLLTAGESWDTLAVELESAANDVRGVVAGLPWLGLSSQRMVSAVLPYISWLEDTAQQARVTGVQASSAAAAFSTAFAATVPPPVIAANRAQLLMLIATNILGQNTPAIMANEAMYAEMWATDAAAMYSYQASATAATGALPKFTAAPPVAHAASAAVGLGNSSIWNWLTTPNSFLTALGDPTTPVGFVEAQWLSTSSSGPWQALSYPLMMALMGQANGMMGRSNDLTEEGNRISQTLVDDDDKHIGHRSPVNPGEAPTTPGNSPKVSPEPRFGVAARAGGLSVPPAWNGQVKLASVATPLSSPGMLPTPIAAVNPPQRKERKGDDILQVKLILPKGV